MEMYRLVISYLKDVKVNSNKQIVFIHKTQIIDVAS